MIPALSIGHLHPIQWAALALLAALLAAIVTIWRMSRPRHPACRRAGHRWDTDKAVDFGDTRLCLVCGEIEEWTPDASGWSPGFWEQRKDKLEGKR